MFEFWNFQQQLSRRLMGWAIVSVTLGVLGMLSGRRFFQGMGSQFAGWGLVDGLIGLAGSLSAKKKQAALQATNAKGNIEYETRKLEYLLLANTALDVGYVAGGVWLATGRGKKDVYWRGSAWGVILQGGFLFTFDLFHAIWLRLERKV